MNKQIVILFGPPGAGKGTQAELLSDKLSLYYFETSKIIETHLSAAKPNDFEEVGNKKYLLSEEKKLWEEGKLNTPEVVAFWVKGEIKKLYEQGENLILAGSPRSLYEAEEIIPLLKKLYGAGNIKVFLIEISPEETIFRNSNRRICELMRHPVLYNKETENLKICPLDGSKLIRRKGLDDPESIKVRLKVYKERTYPVVEIFEKQRIKVNKINGEQSVADVHKEILSVIQK